MSTTDSFMNQQITSVKNSGLESPAGIIGNRIAASRSAGPSFGEVLAGKVDGLKFSAHAETRLKSRNITMTPEAMEKLTNAVNGAAGKGCRDSLVLMNNCAFIVNIPNRTVVTAMDGDSIRENIFTNIDSTVIAG
jgi:flagellar operon protein